MAERDRPGGATTRRKLDFSQKVARNFADNRPMFVRYLRSTECLCRMNCVIEGFDAAFSSRVRERKSKDGEQEANELFVQRLEESKDRGKWQSFINVLLQTGYVYLHKLLTGEPVSVDRERYVKIVELLTPTIMEKVKPADLLADLVVEGCINGNDKQNIESVVTQHGNIAGAELLLSRVTRLRDDWFRGLMTALYRAGMITLMEEIDPDFTAKLLDGEDTRCEQTASASQLSTLDLGSPAVRVPCDSPLMSPYGSPQSPGNQTFLPVARSVSPPLSTKPTLPLTDYQSELYTSVPSGKNTLILAPRRSGKGNVALRLVQKHLAEDSTSGGKVVYLVDKSNRAREMRRRCQEFLTDLPSVELSAEKAREFDKPVGEVVSENKVVVGTADFFYDALKKKLVSLEACSLVIVELTSEYFGNKRHTFKRIMTYYHKLKRDSVSLPQILVLTPSICGLSPLEDLFCTAMETCAEFDIQATAMVGESRGSLRKISPMPVVERTFIPKRQNDSFVESVEELMLRLENVVRDEHQSMEQPADHPTDRMSVLSSPPSCRTSVEYMTWLKTNKSKLGDAAKRHKCEPSHFFLTCLRLAQFCQSGLFINSANMGVQAFNYLKSKLKIIFPLRKYKSQSMNQALSRVLNSFEETLSTLRGTLSQNCDNPMIEALEQKLAALLQENRESRVLVLVRYPVMVVPTKFYMSGSTQLSGFKTEAICHHHKDYAKCGEIGNLLENGFNVLITTSSILAYHLGGVFTSWDAVIRTDCPGRCLITWRHPDQLGQSQFSYSESDLDFDGVDLFRESSIEKAMLEIRELQAQSQPLMEECMRNIQTATANRDDWIRYNPKLKERYEESEGELFCNGCGAFVCNKTFVRKLDDLFLGLDPRLLHRVKTIKHPAQNVFSKGYAKLGRIVCKDCGQKWGIVVYVLLRPYLALAKDGLDFLVNGHFQEYNWKWIRSGIDLDMFEYERDALRCLPSTFCVDGESIESLLTRLPTPSEE